MNNPTNKSSFLPHLRCSIFGHKFEVSKRVTYHVKEYKCCNCKKELTTNSNGNLTELTPKFREINSILERIHKKRQKRLSREVLSTNYKMSS